MLRGVSIGKVRRLLSILLLAVVGLPLAAPIFAATSGSESSLPACCRRAGKHHCMGAMEMGSEAVASRPSSKPSVLAPRENCPYAPASVASVLHDVFGAPVVMTDFDVLQSHDAVVVQAESKGRISRIRSRPKRGPPTLSAC